jgi:phenylalanyl-tRNA synthetase beta chain
MLFSEQWLREWVSPAMKTQQLMDQLTMAGLEVDGSAPVAREFTGVVVGRIEEISKHPDADKLNVCIVSDGESTFQVVCGAPNARKGLLAPFAKVGAEIIIPGEKKPFRIKAAKLRGVESNGMLCSAEELGLDSKSDGLLELPDTMTLGQDVRQALSLDDVSIEIDLTPNRGDCLGMAGLAREVGVLAKLDVTPPETVMISETVSDAFPIAISAPDACPRYLGRVIKNIDLDAKSPLWLQEKLRRSGLRSIDPVVDVTNFVLMELGQPMHAFDFDKLSDAIDVRFAHENEVLMLLDGKEATLTANTLVIADSNGPLAIAGIMGGLSSSVTDETQNVFLECAFFAPLAIAGRARAYGLHTDASHRYERGVDFDLQHRAMARATQLLLEIAGGEAGPVVESIGNLPTANSVRLKFSSVSKLLGIAIPTQEMLEILTRLGFKLTEIDDLGALVAVPSFRFDVSIEADLIEELARVYGYNKLPKTPGLGRQVLQAPAEAKISLSRLKLHLVANGYQEIVTYSFIDPSLLKAIVGEVDDLIPLQNPISEELSIMRPSMLPGLLQTLQYNQNRQQDRVRIFESGLVFCRKDDATEQTPMFAGLISGSRLPVGWSEDMAALSFFDLKGDVEGLLEMGGSLEAYEFSASKWPGFHDGQCAVITHQDKGPIGVMGAIHPTVVRELGVTGPVFAFEIQLGTLTQGKLPKSQAPSKFPEVNRDLAIVVDESVSAAQILAQIRAQGGDFLVDLRIFDVYQGDAVQVGKKSIALGLTWQHPSRNLTDDEINTIISNTVKALQEQFNANLRN